MIREGFPEEVVFGLAVSRVGQDRKANGMPNKRHRKSKAIEMEKFKIFSWELREVTSLKQRY